MKTLMLICFMGALASAPGFWESTTTTTTHASPAPAPGPTPAAAQSTAKGAKAKPRTVQTLVPLTALAALPKPGKRRAIVGYRGSAFLVGVVRSAKQWNAFAQKAGKPYAALRINWKREMVVWAVFTGQTNSLSFKRWVSPKNGAAQLHIHWSGIEPYYKNATPGVFHVVPRAGVRRITVKTKSGYAAGRSFTFRVR